MTSRFSETSSGARSSERSKRLTEVDNDALLSPEEISQKTLEVLEQKVAQNDRVPELLDLSKISPTMGDFLGEVVRGGRNDFFSHLPEKIDLSQLSEGASHFLGTLSHKIAFDDERSQQLLNRLPESIDLDRVSKPAGEFLKSLVRRGYSEELFDRLPTDFDLSQISEGAEVFLKFLTLHNPLSPERLHDRLPTEFDFSQISEGAGNFLGTLVFREYGEELFERLPSSLDFSTLSEGAIIFLKNLALKGYDKEIFDLLPNPLSSADIGENLDILLKVLLQKKRKNVKEILHRLPAKLDFSQISTGFGSFLGQLVYRGHGKELLDRSPKVFDLSTASSGAGWFLQALVEMKLGEGLVSRLPQTIDLSQLNSGVEEFLEFLVKETGQGKELIEKSVKEVEGSLRQPIKHQELSLNQKAGPYLFEIIERFPDEFRSAEDLRGGWTKIKLDKNHSSTYVYIKLGDSPQIVFRNDDIPRFSLKVYQRAAELLPDYVSSPVYQELNGGEETQPLFRSQGFREVYAGPSLQDIDFTVLPRIIRDNMNTQINYILFKLLLAGIDHGHSHAGNFNVRFLLTDKNGEKEISFDVNNAIQLAKKKKLTLTPIVTLRDWDMANAR